MTLNDLPFGMLKCLICTIIIEIFVAFLIGIKNKKDLLNILLVNIVTNPIVSSIPVYFNVFYNLKIRNISLIILEILTLFTEGVIYKKYLKYKKINPFLISLILNLSSYLIGEIINRII